jgi:hypothetical protein
MECSSNLDLAGPRQPAPERVARVLGRAPLVLLVFARSKNGMSAEARAVRA